MVVSSDSSFAADVLPFSWTNEQLKKFLKEKDIPVSGLKHELFTKANDFTETETLESELDVKAASLGSCKWSNMWALKCPQKLVSVKSYPKPVMIPRCNDVINHHSVQMH